MSEHVRELLPLAGADVLAPGESERVERHLRECPACAREAAGWRLLARELGRLPAPPPSRLLLERTLEAVEARRAERAEQAWNRAALGFLVAFAWSLTVASWGAVELLAGQVALRLDRPVGATAGWYAVYVAAGWLSAAAAAVLLGRRARAQGGVS